jgi:hypothetical protein
MPFELRALLSRQLLIAVSRDELDELPAGDKGPGQENLPLDVERLYYTDTAAATSTSWWRRCAGVPNGATSQYTLMASVAVVKVWRSSE